MSDYNLKASQTIKDKHLEFLSKEVAALSNNLSHEASQFNRYVESVAGSYRGDHLPLFQPILAIRHQLPWKEHIERNSREIHEDLNILSGEHKAVGDFLVDSFNSVQSEKKRLTNRIKGLHNLIGDLNLVTGEDTANIVYFKDSFTDSNSLDMSFVLTGVQPVTMSTQEGILTLGQVKSVNLSENARIAQVSGNGTPGAEHLVKKVKVKTSYGKETEAFRYLTSIDQDYHNDANSLVDSRPDTIFEYQRVNVPESFKAERQYYDFGWASSEEKNDTLRLKLTFDLGSVGPLNWIGISPYFDYGSTGRILVHSINTSVDGFEYKPLYPEHRILNQELSAVQSQQHLEEVFTGNTDPALASYTGSGVWVFPEQSVRYVEIVFDQDQSYPLTLGQSVYSISTENGRQTVYLPEPAELKEAEPGEYIRTGSGQRMVYKKEIDITDNGWRYAIGLRDIYFMRYEYSPKALFVSKKYEVEGDIQRVVLYANEIIPTEYQRLVAEYNNWITYEVSFDDLNWTRISPMHHEPVNDDFPPKILEINNQDQSIDLAFQVHKQNLVFDKPIRQVRWRAVLSRPVEANFQYTTPILHDVALKIELRGETV